MVFLGNNARFLNLIHYSRHYKKLNYRTELPSNSTSMPQSWHSPCYFSMNFFPSLLSSLLLQSHANSKCFFFCGYLKKETKKEIIID